MAFLLAITMGMAGDRFDTRRGLVQHEANAIGTTYLRAGYSTSPASDQVREHAARVRAAAHHRSDPVQLAGKHRRSRQQMTDQLWTITQDLVKANPDSESMSLFVETVNDTIDLQCEPSDRDQRPRA